MAGLATLALIVLGLWITGRSDDTTDAGRPGFGQPIGGAALMLGDCIDIAPGPANSPAGLILADCDSPHAAQVTARLSHPDAGGDHPGAAELATWVGRQCEQPTDDFVGVESILETSLEGDVLLPDADDWAAGDTGATCFVANLDGSSLTASVEGRGGEFPRGEEVLVSRLLAGDCFVPPQGHGAYELNSSSRVELVSCDGGHNGVFFGRDLLDQYPVGAEFPGDDEIGRVTSGRCAELFEDGFAAEADGFNYRYWRPNQQSWELDDRSILCAVLDEDALSETFDPTTYEPFFDLTPTTCFNLGPEETSKSLRLDDKVRVLDCSETHSGQMVGSGRIEAAPDDPFPAEDIEAMAGAECEQLFLGFMGISPYESDFGQFPFWYPNKSGWELGDRRYACAIIEDQPRTGSLEGAEL